MKGSAEGRLFFSCMVGVGLKFGQGKNAVPIRKRIHSYGMVYARLFDIWLEVDILHALSPNNSFSDLNIKNISAIK